MKIIYQTIPAIIVLFCSSLQSDNSFELLELWTKEGTGSPPKLVSSKIKSQKFFLNFFNLFAAADSDLASGQDSLQF